MSVGDFPGGPVVKNLTANTGDTGSIPGPGRFHMPRGNEARAPHLLSPRAAGNKATCPRACGLQLESGPQ